jgi:hypothetical protein
MDWWAVLHGAEATSLGAVAVWVPAWYGKRRCRKQIRSAQPHRAIAMGLATAGLSAQEIADIIMAHDKAQHMSVRDLMERWAAES